MSVLFMAGGLVAALAIGVTVGSHDRALARARIVGVAYAEGWADALQSIARQFGGDSGVRPTERPIGDFNTTPEHYVAQINAAREGRQ
jgi:hypothetical protein